MIIHCKENKQWAEKFFEEIEHHPFTIREKYVEYQDRRRCVGFIHYSEEKIKFQNLCMDIYKQLR
jgi:hypothetical protein